MASALERAVRDPRLLLGVLRGMIEAGLELVAPEVAKSSTGLAYYNVLTDWDRQYPFVTMIVGMKDSTAELGRHIGHVESFRGALAVLRARGFEAKSRAMIEAIGQLAEGQYKDSLDLLVRLHLATNREAGGRPPRTLGQKARYIKDQCPAPWKAFVIDDVIDIRNAVAHHLYDFDLPSKKVVVYHDEDRLGVKATYSEHELEALLDGVAEAAATFALAAWLRTTDNAALVLFALEDIGVESLADVRPETLAAKLGLERTAGVLTGPRAVGVEKQAHDSTP